MTKAMMDHFGLTGTTHDFIVNLNGFKTNSKMLPVSGSTSATSGSSSIASWLPRASRETSVATLASLMALLSKIRWPPGQSPWLHDQSQESELDGSDHRRHSNNQACPLDTQIWTKVQISLRLRERITALARHTACTMVQPLKTLAMLAYLARIDWHKL